MRATVLLGYIPSSDLEIFKDQRTQSEVGWRLFHTCLEKMLAPLVAAGKEGVQMVYADGLV